MTTLTPLPLLEIRKLSISQRDVLIAHVASDQPMIRKGPHQGPWAGAKLVDLRCLVLTNNGRDTTLTQRGRHAAGAILGEYADALVASGCLEPQAMPERPSDMLARLKAERRSAPATPTPATPAELATYLADQRSRPRA